MTHVKIPLLASVLAITLATGATAAGGGASGGAITPRPIPSPVGHMPTSTASHPESAAGTRIAPSSPRPVPDTFNNGNIAPTGTRIAPFTHRPDTATGPQLEPPAGNDDNTASRPTRASNLTNEQPRAPTLDPPGR